MASSNVSPATNRLALLRPRRLWVTKWRMLRRSARYNNVPLNIRRLLTLKQAVMQRHCCDMRSYDVFITKRRVFRAYCSSSHTYYTWPVRALPGVVRAFSLQALCRALLSLVAESEYRPGPLRAKVGPLRYTRGR